MAQQIKYEKKHIILGDNFYTVNLSSLLYFPNKQQQKSSHYRTLFNLNKVLVPEELIVKEDNKVTINPDIIKIGKYFDCEFKNKSFSNEDSCIIYHIAMCNEVKKLTRNIKKFVRQRNRIFTKETIGHISDFTYENNNELLDLIELIGKTIPKEKLKITDYYKFNREITKSETAFEVNSIYNYQTLHTVCRNIAMQKTEYYGTHYQDEVSKSLRKSFEHALATETSEGIIYATKIGLESVNKIIDEIDTTLEKINNSKLFTRENFAMLYIMLEPFVEKEKALDKFIKKILKNNIN